MKLAGGLRFYLVYESSIVSRASREVVPERYRIIVTYVLIFFPFVLGFVEI